MTQEEYGEAYLEARDVLYRRGKAVGKPKLTTEGRFCLVDGAPLSDAGLFREAWGDGLANEMTVNMSSIPVMAEAAATCCCDELLSECLAANRNLLTALKRRRYDQIEIATQARREALVALLTHAATHAAGGAVDRDVTAVDPAHSGRHPFHA
jgi:hypothetical protein